MSEIQEKLKYPVTFTPKVIIDADKDHNAFKENLKVICETLNVPFHVQHSKHSSSGKYLSITLKTTIPSAEIMASFYEEIKKIDGVVMTL